MPTSTTIPVKNSSFPAYLDYEKLRTQGIEYLTQLSGELWTDFNIHDPGITILEILCYALTDLGYRNNLAPKDLFYLPPNRKNLEDNFFTPNEILSCNPTTILDYRKLLIDIDGVRNAWLYPAQESEVPLYVDCANKTLLTEPPTQSDQNVVLNGLYEVCLELDTTAGIDTSCGNHEVAVEEILTEVRSRLHKHRNLGEDFFHITILGEEQIGLCLDLELAPEALPDQVLLAVYEQLFAFFSPQPRFYTLQQLLKKGKSTDEIFAGRPFIDPNGEVSHGFIDPVELAQLENPSAIFTSDIYQILHKIPGIRAIKRLEIASFIDGVRQNTGEQWCLNLLDKYHPVFTPELSQITFYKGVLPTASDQEAVHKRFRKQLADYRKIALDAYELDLEVPRGEPRNLAAFTSIQHDFPLVYGIGEFGLPEDAGNLRKAQAKQLKGFLVFFDQLLANYLAQLSQVRDLFSLQPDETSDHVGRPRSRQHSYFTKGLEAVPGLEELIYSYQRQAHPTYKEGEWVATHPADTPYISLAERDRAMARTQAFLGNQQAVCGIEKREGLFFGTVSDHQESILFRGRFGHKAEKDALEEAKLLAQLGRNQEAYERRMMTDCASPALTDCKNPEVPTFTFVLRYLPLNYHTYLQDIAETRDTYESRRERFLNHLLSRFSENFTDYVLLMYALEGKQYKPEKILRDKSLFLQQYPDISRNRGKAFNYLAEEHWNTPNISGFEHRVARLMGLEQTNRRSLTAITVVQRAAAYGFQYKDSQGRVLVDSVQTYPTEPKAKAAYDRFLEIGVSPDNYELVQCHHEGGWSFRIIDPEKGAAPLAVHPVSYASKEDAVKRLHCILHLIDNQGVSYQILNTPKGYFFEIDIPDSASMSIGRLIPYSPYETKLEAYWALYQVLLQSQDPANYEVEDLEFGLEYALGIKDAAGDFLARWEKDFVYPADALTIRDEIASYISHKLPQHTLTESPTSFSYYLNNPAKDFFLQSTYQFESAQDAASALVRIMEAHYDDQMETRPSMEEGSDRPTFDLWLNESYQPPALDDAAISMATCMAENQISYSDKPERRAQERAFMLFLTEVYQEINQLLDANERGWTFVVKSTEGPFLLTGERLFEDEKDAESYYQAASPYLANLCYYRTLPRLGDCEVDLILTDQQSGSDYQVLARHHKPVSPAEAQALIQETVQLFQEAPPAFDGISETDTWGFSIYLDSGECVMTSPQSYRTKAEALSAYLVSVQQVLDGKAVCTLYADNCYYLEIADEDGILLARSKEGGSWEECVELSSELTAKYCGRVDWPWIRPTPTTYSFELQRGGCPAMSSELAYTDKALAAKAFLQFLDRAQDAAFYQHEVEEGFCHCHLRVVDDASYIAVKVLETYPNTDACEAGQRDWVAYFSEKDLSFNVAYSQGKHWFLLQDEFCNPLLEGEDYFEEEDDSGNSPAAQAEAFFWKFWEELQAARSKGSALTPTSPELPGHQVGFSFIFDKGEIKAFHPFTYQHAATRDHLIKQTNQYLIPRPDYKLLGTYGLGDILPLTHPIIHQLPGYFLAVEDPSSSSPCDDKHWENTMLMEGKHPYSSASDAWAAAEGMANRALTEAAFVCAPATHSKCSYHLHLVSERYLLAEYAQQFSTPELRNTALDQCYDRVLYADPLFSYLIFLQLSSSSQSEESTQQERWQIATPTSTGDMVLWEGSVPMTSEKDTATPITPPQVYEWVEQARHEDSYLRYQDLAEKWRLALLNTSGDIIAESSEVYDDEESLLLAQAQRITAARLHPIHLSADGFSYSLYDLQTGAPWIDGRLRFLSETAAQHAFEAFMPMLQDKSYYLPTQESEAGPFGFALIDPAEVLATYPGDLPTYTDCKQKVKEVINAVNAEGFHLIEHILLRPREKGNMLLGNAPSPSVCSREDLVLSKSPEEAEWFSQYLPGADPYSFWVSVVVPYWPSRFRNSNFRSFFETTMRRELPAHIALKICWINLESMRSFEQAYCTWLRNLSLPKQNCDFSAAQDALIEQLSELSNEYPGGRLLGCEGPPGENPTVLGFSTLG